MALWQWGRVGYRGLDGYDLQHTLVAIMAIVAVTPRYQSCGCGWFTLHRAVTFVAVVATMSTTGVCGLAHLGKTMYTW